MNPLLVLLTALAVQAQPSALAQTLDPVIAEFVQARRIPGLAIGVVANGEVVYARGFGETSLGSGKPITTKSIFHMASISKPFTATAMMQLVEAGLIDLDAPITEYLPYFRLAEEESKAISIRQILTHTSGFPDVRDYEWDKPQYGLDAAETYVRSLTHEKMLFPPGEGSRYSNMAFDVLADVVYKLTRMPFEDYTRKRILEPLGMLSSSFLLVETPVAHRTQGHSTAFSDRVFPAPCPVYPYNRRHAPSSTLNSSVEDMCRWMLANLARGTLDGRRILQEASYEEMWSRSDDTPDVGLSWWLEEFFDRPSVVHNGSDVGFVSSCILLPEDGIGAVIMANSDQANISGIMTAALRATLGEEFSIRGPYLWFEFAYVLEQEGLEAAIAYYRKLRETQSEQWNFSFATLDRVSRALLRKDREVEALGVARLNLEFHDDVAAAHARLGQALAAQGESGKARDAFERALQLDPYSDEAAQGLEQLAAP